MAPRAPAAFPPGAAAWYSTCAGNRVTFQELQHRLLGGQAMPASETTNPDAKSARISSQSCGSKACHQPCRGGRAKELAPVVPVGEQHEQAPHVEGSAQAAKDQAEIRQTPRRLPACRRHRNV